MYIIVLIFSAAVSNIEKKLTLTHRLQQHRALLKHKLLPLLPYAERPPDMPWNLVYPPKLPAVQNLNIFSIKKDKNKIYRLICIDN